MGSLGGESEEFDQEVGQGDGGWVITLLIHDEEECNGAGEPRIPVLRAAPSNPDRRLRLEAEAIFCSARLTR